MSRIAVTLLLAGLLPGLCLAQAAGSAAPAPAASAVEARPSLGDSVSPATLRNGSSDVDCQLHAADAGASSADCSYTMYWSHQGRGVTGGTGKVALRDFEGNTLAITLHVPQTTSNGSVTLGTLDALAQTYTVGLSDGLIVGLVPTTVLAGISAKAGTQTLTWLDAGTGTSHSRDQGSWSVGAYLGGTIGPHGSMSVTGYGSVGRGFKDASPGSLCQPPASGTGPLACTSGPIGPPIERRFAVTSLRWAQSLSSMIGYSLTLSHDWRSHISGADLPIYLYRWSSDKGGVSLGFDVSWSNDPATTRRANVALVLTSSDLKLLSTGN